MSALDVYFHDRLAGRLQRLEGAECRPFFAGLLPEGDRSMAASTPPATVRKAAGKLAAASAGPG